ncbi:hypothetical protein Q9Q99_03960 [Curtobacterium flaccumfaciens]|nr:hypothetical protein Q9Q99_03960 [Curtobacterium flaccumfaciens]
MLHEPDAAPWTTGPTAAAVMTVVLALVLAVVAQSFRVVVELWRAGVVLGVVGAVLAVVAATAVAWPVARQLGTALRQRFDTAHGYRSAVRVVVDGLHRAGRIPAYGDGDIRVTPTMVGRLPVAFTMEALGGTVEDRRTVTSALAEAFGPVRTPRFLVETGRGEAAQAAPGTAAGARAVDRTDDHPRQPVPGGPDGDRTTAGGRRGVRRRLGPFGRSVSAPRDRLAGVARAAAPRST